MLRSFGYDLSIKKSTENPRIALFLGHLGLGDQIWLSGAVRYIAKKYDYLEVPCKRHNLITLYMLYSDTPNIHLIDMGRGDYSISPNQTRKGSLPLSLDKYVHIYESGFYKHTTLDFNMNNIPGSFYDDIGLDRSIRHTYFSIPPIPQSKTLYQAINSNPYIFIQTRSSEDVTSIISWNINDILTIDPNLNQYSPDHPWYDLANKFVNQLFLHYIDTIKHASQLHLVNSSFYCLASQITPLDAKVKLCYDRDTGKVMPEYDFT
jgi:hypothetical protein